MEFGLFIQGHVPGKKAHQRAEEHQALLNEAEIVIAADQNNWKYVWVTEHHALTDYSHISASDVYMGYLANATKRIHLGSGIFNLSPRVNHPARNAERAAMLDHLTEGRFEFGTGRGAGSHEVRTFDIEDPSSTKVEWEEVIWQLPRMWRETDYTFEGEHFRIDTPHNILPKPYAFSHPPFWVACGNPPTFEKAGRYGIGALGFNFSPIHHMKPQIEAYKKGIAECTKPVGDYINDNVMLTNSVLCFRDREHARAAACRADRGYVFSLVCLYHDTFPKPEGAPVWPETPSQMTMDRIDDVIAAGAMLCGNAEEVCEQIKAYEETGVDQLVFGLPMHLSKDEAIEVVETFGQKVIPEFDKDPMHSTTRYRNSVVS